MPPKDAKVWNEDLLQALRAREDLSRREGKRDQITWKQGADAIEAVRKDIYTVSLQLPRSSTNLYQNSCL